MKKLSIIIPVFNEEPSIEAILNKIKEVKLIGNLQKEIIVIDDCSTDRSSEIIKSYIHGSFRVEYFYFRQEKSLGKRAAIRKGLELSTGYITLIQNADLEYNPCEYNRLMNPILDGFADVVYGSRFVGSLHHRFLYFFRRVGNAF